MFGCIERRLGLNPAWLIKVDDLPEIRYLGYSKRRAIAAYRREFNLARAKISWAQWTTHN